MTEPRAKIVKNSIETYHQKDGYISKSMLADILDAPAVYKYWHEGEGRKKPKSDSLDIGNAVHTLAIEPELFNDRFCIVPQGMVRNLKHEKYQTFLAANEGKTPLLSSDYEEILAMANGLKEDKAAMHLLNRRGMVEHSLYWDEDFEDSETGEVTTIRWKARPDFLSDDGTEMVCDIKTAANIRPFAFSQACEEHGYAMSVALTNRGYRALKGRDLQTYVFLAVSKTEPHFVECYDTFRMHSSSAQTMLEKGEEDLQKAITKLLKARKTGEWPKWNDEPISPVRVNLWQREK